MPTRLKLNLRKLQHLAGHALQNGIALHFDSVLLYKNRSYGTAHFISVLAMEEIGKAFAADHFAWSERTEGRSDSEFEKDWVGWLLGDHKGKQLSFLRQIVSISRPSYYDVLYGHLEARKQNSIYVGLSKPAKNRPRTDGQLLIPKQVTRIQAKAQLRIIHDVLMDQVDGIELGSIDHDLAVFNQILTPELRRRMMRALPF